MAGAELGQAQRQLAVALQALIEHLNMARAVHRLDRVITAFRLSGEHVGAVVLPVAGALPQHAINHLRRLDLFITSVDLHLAHVLLKHLIDRPAIGMPEHHARRFFLGMEQVQTLANLAVIALLGLFHTLDVGSQLLLVCPGSAVDTLQLLVLGIAAPVGTGNPGQLECFQKARVRHVRATAHVDVFFVVVQAHRLLVGHILDQTQLVLLTTGLEHLDDLVTRGHFLDHVVIGGDQLSHALFDGDHVVRREGALVGNIVIEAIINHRANNHLGGGIQLLDGMTDQVSTGVADNLNAFFILGGNDLQPCVLLDQVTGINQATIYLAGDRSLGQTGTNRLGDFRNGNGIIEIALTAVREGNNGHVPLLLSGDPYARPHDGNAARMPRCSSYRCHDYRQPSSGYCNSTPYSTETKNPATGTGF